MVANKGTSYLILIAVIYLQHWRTPHPSRLVFFFQNSGDPPPMNYMCYLGHLRFFSPISYHLNLSYTPLPLVPRLGCQSEYNAHFLIVRILELHSNTRK